MTECFYILPIYLTMYYSTYNNHLRFTTHMTTSDMFITLKRRTKSLKYYYVNPLVSNGTRLEPPKQSHQEGPGNRREGGSLIWRWRIRMPRISDRKSQRREKSSFVLGGWWKGSISQWDSRGTKGSVINGDWTWITLLPQGPPKENHERLSFHLYFS